MAIAAQKNSKTIPIVIAVLVVVVLVALGYFVYRTLSSNNNTEGPTGASLDTSQLNSQQLQYVQYTPATAPVPSDSDVGRSDPFSPY